MILDDLRNRLVDANIKYTLYEQPDISDQEYDALKHQFLAEWKRIHGTDFHLSVSLLGIVTDDHFATRKHPFRMLSLTNAFSESDVINHFNSLPDDTEYVIEPKYDGVSLELIYEGGVLITAITRGTGEYGEVVTPNAKCIPSIPLEIPTKGVVVVRGEVMMTRSMFKQLNEERLANNKKPFVNCRNAASGSLRQKNPLLTKSRKLLFVPYLIRYLEGDKVIAPSATQTEMLKQHVDVFKGLRRTERIVVKGLSDIGEHIEELSRYKDDLNFDTDGLVIKINDFSYHNEATATSDPTWAIAYKYPEDEVEATVSDLVYQVGRTGQVTPVLELEPIYCGGVMVTRATLHNFTQLKIISPVVGGKVKIKRAGEVIPYVIESLTKPDQPLTPITTCPACEGTLMTKGELTYCTNSKACPEQLQAKFEHFVKRECFDMDGLGGETIEQLIEKGLVNHPVDLFKLTKEDFLSLELFGEKKAEKTLSAITNAKHDIELAKLIYALGILEVGESTATDLAHHFKGDLAKLRGASKFELMEVDGVGKIVSNHVHEFFNGEDVKLVDELLTYVNYVYTPKTNTGELDGKTICITGGFTVPRSQLKKQLESMGAKITGSVSAKTDFVVVGGGAGDKAKKAERLGVPKLNPADYGLTI